MSRPRIGITGPDEGGGSAWFFTGLSVWLAGGWPKRIRPSKPRAIEGLCGLIIGGGADVDPEAYEKEDFIHSYLNQTLHHKRLNRWQRISRFVVRLFYPVLFYIRRMFSKKRHAIDKGRDALEFNLLDEAVKQGIPVMGICRGAQLINIYFKGDLYNDIQSFYTESVNRHSIFPVKKVFLKPGSKLEEILGVTETRVNALHHQAVKTPGEHITIAAWEPNGVVQGIESSNHDFIIGVQWHPEYLYLRKRLQRRLFKSLVKHSGHWRAGHKA